MLMTLIAPGNWLILHPGGKTEGERRTQNWIYPEASNSFLLVTTEHEAEAKDNFSDINITTDVRKLLGSFIGTHENTMDLFG